MLNASKYEQILELASRKSIFYPAAEIYPNSPAGFWDFGPVGQAIRRKIIDFWRKELIQKENMLEIYGSQILPEPVFVGSGHLKSFHDPIVQCTKCRKYERADHLLSTITKTNIPEATPLKELNDLMLKYKITCSKCQGKLSEVTHFSLMMPVPIGIGDKKSYLRGEACQSIFLNFARMVKTNRLKLPQGIAQAGGAFRNEISPRQSITRAIEFSQMEAEIFFDQNKINEIENFDKVKDYKINILRLNKDKIESLKVSDLVSKKIVPGKLIAYYLARVQQVWHALGIPLKSLRFREIGKDERAFYSLATFDFEVETSLGWLELIANNYRTDYDLKNHSLNSGADLTYLNQETNKKILPHIWEISAGIDRTLYAVLEHSLKQGKEGLYFSLNYKLAPFDCAILPLINKEGLPELAKEIQTELQDYWFDVFYDASGSVGRRYARADEIGIPFDITIDFDSLKNKDVTIRDRDSTKQIRVKIKDLKSTLIGLIKENKQLSDFGKYIN